MDYTENACPGSIFLFHMTEHYYSLNRYLQEQFHEKVYKLALRGGQTCPNRDGTAGTGGCVFCAEGSGSFAADSIDEAVRRLKDKYKGCRYIAYFQSYTCTYHMSAELIRQIYAAARDERIAAISLATRPDCLPPEVMDLIRELNKDKPVWVELGLQSMHEKTASLINRGYPLETFEKAVTALRGIGAEVIVHLILGLPGEGRKEILDSVRYLNGLDIQGVKLQMLHILRGTVLGTQFLEGGAEAMAKLCFSPETCEGSDPAMCCPFSFPDYADLVCDCICHLRRDIVIHRITGDAPKKDLLAPLWSGDKKRVLNDLRKRMDERKIIQGSQVS